MAGSATNAAPRFPAPPVALLGIPFDNVTPAEAVELIAKGVATRTPQYLITANVRLLVQACDDAALRRALFEARLVLAAGRRLVWASRLLGNPLPERVAGSDLLPLLLRTADQRGYRLHVLCHTPEVVEQAIGRIKQRHPNLQVTGSTSQASVLQDERHDEDDLQHVRRAKPDLLLVSLGFPRQEKWIAAHYRMLGVPVSLSLEGAIASLAGSARRDRPHPFQSVADAWVFARAILAQWWRMQFRSRKSPTHGVSAPVRSDVDWRWIKLPARLDLEAVNNDVLLLDQLLADGRHCLIEMSNVQFIDSTGIGHLIRLHKRIQATGRELVLLAPSEVTLRTLALVQLQDYFAMAPNLDAAKRLLETRTAEKSSSVTAWLADGASALIWRGEATAANAEEVWKDVEAYLRGTNPPDCRFIVDLSQLRFVDGSGIGVMVRCKKLAQELGLRISFEAPRPEVESALHLAGLKQYLLGDK